jgi:hypothetical protein
VECIRTGGKLIGVLVGGEYYEVLFMRALKEINIYLLNFPGDF